MFSKIKNRRVILLNLLIGLIVTIYDLFYAIIIYAPDDVNVFEGVTFYLISIPLFSKIFLKENMYKHHYFSFLISIIGIILLNIPVCSKLTEKDIVPNIINFIRGIIYSFIYSVK